MEGQFGTAYERLGWDKKGPASKFMKEFEAHKRDFGKSDDPSKYYELQLVMRDAPRSRYYDEAECTVRIYESVN